MQRGTRVARSHQRDPRREADHRRRRPTPSTSAHVRGEIEFRGVSVDYGSTLALDGVDLRIPAGATVAVVGHTGSGKSTLVNLIPRLMDPTAGRGPARRHRLAASSIRRSCGGRLASFRRRRSSSARPSRRTSRSESSRPREEQIRRAAEIAGLAADIESFPEGYRHHGGRARHHALRRPEAADGHRPRHSARSPHFDPG